MRKCLIILTLLLLLFIFFASVIIAKDNIEDIKATIQSINEVMDRAVVEGDYETVLLYYSDDAIIMPNFSPILRGKKSLKKQMEKDRQLGLKLHSFSGNTVDIWQCGDLVYEMGAYGLSASTSYTPLPVADHGTYFTIWQKQSDGSYKIKLSIWNTDVNPRGK